jgi:methylase of polypeptide subunit release factors
MQGENILSRIQYDGVYAEDCNIFDFGCGDGCFAAALHRNGVKGSYHGVDINTSWISQLNHLFSKNVK